MIPVRCRSNLDLVNEQWPEQLCDRPVKGDYIISETRWGDFQLRLEVVAVTHKDYAGDCYLEVELHIPLHLSRSVSQFQEWYKEARSPH